MELLPGEMDFSRRRGRPSIHIAPTNADIVGGQSHTITCSVSSVLGVTDLTWIKTTASGDKIVNVCVDGKFSGGTLSDPSLTINNIVKSDEGTYLCRATNFFGTASSEDSVLTCKECIEVEIIEKGPIAVGYGGTAKINANIISNSTGSLEVNWQKTHNNCSTNLMIDLPKYYGSSCQMNQPQLVINNVDKEDAGIYKLEVISPTEAKSSPGILLQLHEECIEVEIIEKGPIAVGYGGTAKINANIISNSTGSLEVNWQKTHNNCSTNLMIDLPKYYGSSCQMNQPQLVINNVDKEDAGIYKLEVISPTEAKSSPGILLQLHEECIEVEIIEKGPIAVGYGGTAKINANIISNSTGSLEVNWQKTHNNCSTNLMIDLPKYYGSSCQMNKPQLVINNVDKEDAGIYKLEVISPTEAKSSPGILLQLHEECIEVEIIEKGPIAVGYGGTAKINANIISNSTGSLEVNWQKTHNNCSTNLMIDLPKYYGSSCQMNKPQLVINNVDKEDAGIYKLEVISPTEAKSSPGILLQLHEECIEVEIIEKGPIAVGYGGTAKINANIISNSTGSLEVNWQKTHNNCSTNLMIDLPKYYGSSCQMNKPQLVINNVDKEDAGIYKLEVISPTEAKSSPGILLQLHEDEADTLSKEENNYVRLLFLCLKIGTQAVRLYFDNKVPRLESFLTQHRSSLTSQRSRYRCTKAEELMLFPGGQVAVSADFAINLLYKLIRNLLTAIPAPTCGWGNQPLPEHINEADDIERIRCFRNILLHNFDSKICDTDFSILWTDLAQAIDRLSKGSLSRDVESIRVKIFEPKQHMTECQTDIVDNRQEIHNIPFDIQKGHLELINKWRIEDELFYDRTRGFMAALKMVQSENYVTIIGEPASGKTATARHIALHLEQQGWKVVPVCRLEEIIQYRDRDHKQVFVLDDVLGVLAVDMNIYTHIINYKEQIFKAIEGSKLLFTCRTSVYKEVFNLGLFVTENILDLQGKDNQLTETEHMAICQHHCKSKDVNPDLYTSLSFNKANHMFPFLCKVFSMEKAYQRFGESFFNKPFECFIKELDNLQLTETIQYAVLVLCLVNGSKLSVELLPQEDIQKEIFNNCRINIDTPNKKIKDAIYQMSEAYFTKFDNEYTFTHDFIFEVIAYHYGCQNKHQILKYLSSSYIANKITVYEQASDEDLCIHISEDMFLPLAERLYQEIKNMNLFHVFMNSSLKHSRFLNVFNRMLKSKPYDEFKSLILEKNFVEKTFSVDEPVGLFERDRLFLLFEKIFCVASGTSYDVRVISWIINFGHIHLLQEIVNHVEDNNHSIYLVFGSNVMENKRLLLLGCFSNNLDMVELILKYIDPKCIDMEYTYYGKRLRTRYTPLTLASELGNLGIVKALLRNVNHVDINKCNDWEESPLILASEHRHCDIVKFLLSSGADTNLCDTLGQSPLILASRHGHCDIVKCLHSSGADVNLSEIFGQSPLFVASQEGHCDIVKCLLISGADINLLDKDGKSPLFVASQEGHCDIVKCLLISGADINLLDEYGQSPLFVASQEGHCDIVKCLLNSGADVNLCTKCRQSPLLVASEKRHCDIVKYLLNSGADVNLHDEYGQSPMFVASSSGYEDITRLLTAHEAL